KARGGSRCRRSPARRPVGHWNQRIRLKNRGSLMKATTLLLFLLTGLWVPARAATYKIDPEHSTVVFHIHHLIGKVTGHFDRFQGTVDYEAGRPETWKTSATIAAASINTQSAKRDAHLRSEDFFEVEKYPAIAFQ